IVGGGFHGKSTLLTALERSIYNHIPGDGRERIVTDGNAMKIRAEDGRCVHNLNLANYINHLPMGKNTSDFSTQDAS
ncbi:isopentenyl-diphosphate delta-isomerase, partial [Vibrio furnissii]